jgi:putative acetyltransferase
VTLSIRRARAGDGETIRRIHLASIRGLGGRAYPEEVVEAWAHDRDPEEYPIDEDDTAVFLAEQAGSVVGFGWITYGGDPDFRAAVDGKIGAVYVHPSVARQGVGTTIYQALETRAREAGLESLGLWASLPAVPFYEAQGYERVREVEYEFDDGVTGLTLEMKKGLGEASSSLEG